MLWYKFIVFLKGVKLTTGAIKRNWNSYFHFTFTFRIICIAKMKMLILVLVSILAQTKAVKKSKFCVIIRHVLNYNFSLIQIIIRLWGKTINLIIIKNCIIDQLCASAFLANYTCKCKFLNMKNRIFTVCTCLITYI